MGGVWSLVERFLLAAQPSRSSAVLNRPNIILFILCAAVVVVNSATGGAAPTTSSSTTAFNLPSSKAHAHRFRDFLFPPLLCVRGGARDGETNEAGEEKCVDGDQWHDCGSGSRSSNSGEGLPKGKPNDNLPVLEPPIDPMDAVDNNPLGSIEVDPAVPRLFGTAVGHDDGDGGDDDDDDDEEEEEEEEEEGEAEEHEEEEEDEETSGDSSVPRSKRSVALARSGSLLEMRRRQTGRQIHGQSGASLPSTLRVLKEIWRDYLQPPNRMSDATLPDGCEESRASTASPPTSKSASPLTRGAEAAAAVRRHPLYDAVRRELRQVSTDFYESASGPPPTSWLDRATLLKLLGAAAVIHHAEIFEEHAFHIAVPGSPARPVGGRRPSAPIRGIRLMSALSDGEGGDVADMNAENGGSDDGRENQDDLLTAPSGKIMTHAMQEAVATAVADATGAQLVAIDEAVLESVRSEFEATFLDMESRSGVGSLDESQDPKMSSDRAPDTDPHDAERRTPAMQRQRNRFARPSKRRLLEALFALAHEMDEPFLVFLRSRGDAIFRSRSALVAIRDEFYRGIVNGASDNEVVSNEDLASEAEESNFATSEELEEDVSHELQATASRRRQKSKILFVLSTVEDLSRRSIGSTSLDPSSDPSVYLQSAALPQERSARTRRSHNNPARRGILPDPKNAPRRPLKGDKLKPRLSFTVHNQRSPKDGTQLPIPPALEGQLQMVQLPAALSRVFDQLHVAIQEAEGAIQRQHGEQNHGKDMDGKDGAQATGAVSSEAAEDDEEDDEEEEEEEEEEGENKQTENVGDMRAPSWMGIELVHRAFHDEKLGKQISAHLEKALQKSSLNGAAPGQSPDGVSIQVVLEQHKREVDETLQDEGDEGTNKNDGESFQTLPSGAGNTRGSFSGISSLPQWLEGFLRKATREREAARQMRGDEYGVDSTLMEDRDRSSSSRRMPVEDDDHEDDEFTDADNESSYFTDEEEENAEDEDAEKDTDDLNEAEQRSSVSVPPPRNAFAVQFEELAHQRHLASSKMSHSEYGSKHVADDTGDEDEVENEDDESGEIIYVQKKLRRRRNQEGVGSGSGDDGYGGMNWRSKSCSLTSEELLNEVESLFEVVTVSRPADASLRSKWAAWVEAERKSFATRQSLSVLRSVLLANGLHCPNLRTVLGDVLGQRRGPSGSPHTPLSTLEARRVVFEALKIEVARTNGQLKRREKTTPSASEGGGSAAHSHPLDSPSRSQAAMVAVALSQKMVPPPSNSPRHSQQEELIISTRSLELALSLVIGAVNLPALQLPGTPVSRTTEQVKALAKDKHERALVPNVISPQDIGVSYENIGGLEEVKNVLQQCITYPLKYPHLYSEGIAAEAVKGVLLFGPPGTGKTMLAKAVATEGGATFISIDASSIENKWLGESEKNAKAMFTLARRLAPCVIYIDEVDSILSSREQGDESSHGTLTSVKTTIMQEWDGLRTTQDRVVVIGSTNRPFDLDEAVLRRMPRRVLVDLPDLKTREEILKVSLKGNRLAGDVNLTQVAQKLEGYTGSDIKEVCREAVVRISHEEALRLEQMGTSSSRPIIVKQSKFVKADTDCTEDEYDEDVDKDEDEFNLDTLSAPEFENGYGKRQEAILRPVSKKDLEKALSKLSASVNERGREMSKVIDWNEQYGEIKKKKKKASYSMYL